MFWNLRRFFYKLKRKAVKRIAETTTQKENLGDRAGRTYSRREAIALSQKIYEIEHANWRTLKQWRTDNVSSWVLMTDKNGFNKTYLEKSEDCMSWCLWRTYTDQAREFYKAVPAFYLDRETIERLLYHHPWICI